MKDYWDCDYIFIDTAGEITSECGSAGENEGNGGSTERPPETIMCFWFSVPLPNIRDLQRIADCYGKIADYELIFTKLDETEAVGNLLNMKLYTGAPVAYVTCGQNVPDDMEVFNPQKTVKRILGGKE